jgi:hypothetical protein
VISKLTISGKQVSSSTLVTGIPACSSADAVPPVETMVYLQQQMIHGFMSNVN